jgi:hypothetical protein
MSLHWCKHGDGSYSRVWRGWDMRVGETWNGRYWWMIRNVKGEVLRKGTYDECLTPHAAKCAAMKAVKEQEG